jgi:hypothetical protein
MAFKRSGVQIPYPPLDLGRLGFLVSAPGLARPSLLAMRRQSHQKPAQTKRKQDALPAPVGGMETSRSVPRISRQGREGRQPT